MYCNPKSLRRSGSTIDIEREHLRVVYRPPCKMKTLLRLSIALMLILLVLGLSALFLSSPNRQPGLVYPAMINRDCAPWDGPAFTVSIPYEPGTSINISIWQAPEIKLPAIFSFPDPTMRVGSATILLRFSHSVDLTGTVFHWRVQPGRPVEGRFELVTDAGQRLKGDFVAEWADAIVYCG